MSDIETSIADRVATITLNRPERMNALTTPLLDALVGALEEVLSADSVRVVVLRGAGGAFCAGGDLVAMAEEERTGEATRAGLLRRHTRAAQLLREAPVVTIAAVDGACAGAGFSLAAACDLRLASETALFRSAFLTAGISGDFGLSWSLSHLLGQARAREILLLNDKIDATRAKEIGLVLDVVARGEFDAAVDALAARMAAAAPLAVAGIKQNLEDAATCSFSTALDRETERHVRTGRSADAAEAGRAFLERRTPVFQGR